MHTTFSRLTVILKYREEASHQAEWARVLWGHSLRQGNIHVHSQAKGASRESWDGRYREVFEKSWGQLTGIASGT